MARNGADDWDDDGRGKKSGGGTMALDVGKMEIDDKPSGRPGTRGGRGHDAGGGHGRSAALGRSPHQDDDDAVSSSGRARRGGGGKKGGDEWGSPGGFGKSSGTAALDVRGLELDGDRPAKNRRADWAQSGGKPKGRDLDDDDDPGYAKKGKGLVGSRRDSAVRLEPGEAEIDSGFHDWSTPKPASTSSPEQRAVGAAPASGEESTPAKLLVREPGKPDRLFPLHPKNRSWIVGREISCDLVLSDIKSSRQHFEITFLGGVFSLKDLGSGNGTKVDGEKVSRVQLSGGSIVTVGDCELVFQLDQQALNRLQEREKPGGKGVADGDGAAGDADEQKEGESAQPERLLSYAAVALILMVLLGMLAFAGVFVTYLVFRSPAKKPPGAKVVELEEIPQSDPRLRAAEQASARAVLGVADSQHGLGKLWDARRMAKVALLLNPSLPEARSLDARLERSLKGDDSAACHVLVEPTNPVRGRPMSIRVALNGPVSQVQGSFAGDALRFAPDTQLEGAWTSTLETPRKASRGAQKLELSIVDLLDETVDLQREISVR